MHAQGFDVLTWRKGSAEDVDPDLFTNLTCVDQPGRTHQWLVGDTTVDLPVGETGEVFTTRQVSLTVANNKTGRQTRGQDSTRQIHILTTRAEMSVEQVIYRMGSRWRQENYFRYARMHFDLDSHDAYATTDDDPTRLVPNPAKKKAHRQVLAARVRYERALATTDAALLEATCMVPPIGSAYSVLQLALVRAARLESGAHTPPRVCHDGRRPTSGAVASGAAGGVKQPHPSVKQPHPEGGRFRPRPGPWPG
jgi:hypothetical protein